MASALACLLAYPVAASSAGEKSADAPETPRAVVAKGPHFVAGERCMACHNGMVTASGRDLSFGLDWRTSMMANSARDPYWQAAVRRETLDHPESSAAIQNECSRCHMPMANAEARARGGLGEVFTHLPIGPKPKGALEPVHAAHDALAADGVSCTVCHRIEDGNLGDESSFTGGFEIDLGRSSTDRLIYGPYDIEQGLSHVMSSAIEFKTAQSEHIRSSELCATCHTLITHTLGPGGEVLGELPEQVPYLEWLASDYAETQSCQDCHMPPIEGETPIASVLGEPRSEVRSHAFRGSNFFMQRLLARYRAELGVAAGASELAAAADRAERHLADASATLRIEGVRRAGGALSAEVHVDNRAGHKLPTAYPSRRAWLHFVVRDAEGTALFESGALRRDGAIEGNDNDADKESHEPHYEVVDSSDQVQIYETILEDPQGRLTTGLLTAIEYRKDNRLLPRGFDKTKVEERVAPRGRAVGDADFVGGGDVVRYRIALPPGASGPFEIEATLRYQPIGFRWAENFEPYGAGAEPGRFLRMYRSMAQASAADLARAVARAE